MSYIDFECDAEYRDLRAPIRDEIQALVKTSRDLLNMISEYPDLRGKIPLDLRARLDLAIQNVQKEIHTGPRITPGLE